MPMRGDTLALVQSAALSSAAQALSRQVVPHSAASTGSHNAVARPEEIDTDCDTGVHRLPFNADSPTWLQERMERPAVEERMSRLVKTLEAEVIPRLVEAHRAHPVSEILPVASVCPAPTTAEVEAFVQLVLRREDMPISACIEALRGKGMSIEVLFLDLLAPAANHLGYLWEEDLCDFTNVTIAVGRLQHLLQILSPSFGTEVGFPAHARRALLVPSPGEQHTFGLSMVAEFFMRAGWQVAGGQGAYRDEAPDLVSREWFDVVGFSVGSEARLDLLTTCVTSVRQMSRNRDIGVLVGGPIFVRNPELVALVGADATSPDGKQAPVAAEALIANRVRSRA